MEAIKNRYEFVMYFDVENGNRAIHPESTPKPISASLPMFASRER